MRNRDTQWWEQTGNGYVKTGKIYTKRKKKCGKKTNDAQVAGIYGSHSLTGIQTHRIPPIASMRFILHDAHTNYNLYIYVYTHTFTIMYKNRNSRNCQRCNNNKCDCSLYFQFSSPFAESNISGTRYTHVSTHCACLIWCKYKNIIFRV